MTDLNTALRVQPDAVENPMITDLTVDFRRRDNAAFLARVAQLLQQAAAAEGPGGTRIHPGGVACIGLLGEYSLAGYSILRAQDVLRLDRTPRIGRRRFCCLGSCLTTQQ